MKKILELYNTEVRANPASTPGLKLVSDEYITRLEGAFNFICSWKFSNDKTLEVVKKQASYFRERGEELMWRVYDHDKPSNLEASLKQEGFIKNPSGTLMILPLKKWQTIKTDHDIRPVTTSAALEEYLSVAAAAFNSPTETGEFEYFERLLSEPEFTLFTGYADGKPVVSGRLEMPSGTSFGLLFGGGVIPSHRGKGYYRALVETRVSSAQARGLKYVSTEAWNSSKPILEKLGFIPMGKETTWTLPTKTKTEIKNRN